MKKMISIFLTVLLAFMGGSCKKEQDYYPVAAAVVAPDRTYTGFPEGFESGTKTAYAAGNVTLGSGSWNLSDALIGNLANDKKVGARSMRMQSTGMATMNFDLAGGATQVSVKYARYGTDANSSFTLWYSSNAGSSWTQTGTTISVTNTTLATATFTMSVTGNVRFQLRKGSGGRLNIDDLSIEEDSPTNPPGQDDNLAMGNPSGAVTSTGSPNNYLVVKSQYALSYNNSRGTPNWVSWHLSTAWKGGADRCDCFTQDGTLPGTFYRATTSNYTNTGFNRGHMCPSEDRDLNDPDNAATFLMTNIMPQAPNLNQGTWEALETYCRTLMGQGNELYILSGGYGSGGTGSNGGTTTTIAGGNITVPSRCWKVIVVLPVGSNDVSRVSTATRVIAVDVPNNQATGSWGGYRVPVNSIEAATGYDFLSAVSTTIQSTIEASVDNGPTQ
jgi:endonuclease G, mitochondrial